MRNMNFMIEKSKGKITVTVTTSQMGDYENRTKCRTEDVEQYLSDQNIKFGECVTADVLTNTNPNKNMAIWKFEDPSYKAEKKKTSKTKKTLIGDPMEKEELYELGLPEELLK